MEGDASPPLGARRRFSALMDTHRFASPLEGEPDSLSRQVPIRVRGTSLDSTSVPSPSLQEQRTSLKELNVAGVLELKDSQSSDGEEKKLENEREIEKMINNKTEKARRGIGA